jgi:hypothetical protein
MRIRKHQLAYCFLLATGLALALPEAARAWKPYTHNWTGDQARLDAINNGHVTINGRSYPVPQKVVDALTKWPAFYDGGITGDACPDLLFSQSLIHPHWTGEWLKLMYDAAWAAQAPSSDYTDDERGQILAFTYGFLSHAAGDMWGHTLMNDFSGGVFPGLKDIAAKPEAAVTVALKHLLVEGYVCDATPGWDGNRDERKVLPDGDVSDDSTPGRTFDFPHKFIYRTLIDPNAPTPWDPDDPTPKIVPPGNYIAGRGILIGSFLNLRAALVTYKNATFGQSSAQNLQDALDCYNGTLDALSRVDCDFDDNDEAWFYFAEGWDCSKTLGILAGTAVVNSVEALGTLVVDTAETLFLEILHSYIQGWIDDIDEGLQNWSQFGLATTKALFDPQARRDLQNKNCADKGTDVIDPTDPRSVCENAIGMLDVLKEELDPFIENHLKSMLGEPDIVIDVQNALQPVQAVFDKFLADLAALVEVPLDPLREAATDFKEWAKDWVTQKIETALTEATGIDVGKLEDVANNFKDFAHHPGRWICVPDVIFTFPPPSPLGTLTFSVFGTGERARLDGYMGLGDDAHEDVSPLPAGCGRLLDSAVFDPDRFAAIRNTITMAKLLLLDGPELNHVLSDILCHTVTTYQAGQNVMIDSLDVPENKPRINDRPPAWLLLIDGDHAWRRDGHPRFIDEVIGPGLDALPTARPYTLDGGSGFFPLWESCELRPSFRVLFKDWENGNDNFPNLGDETSGTCPCFEVNNVTLHCLPDASAMAFFLKNNSTNSINSIGLSGFPTGVVANPSVFQLQSPIGLGEEAQFSTIISGLGAIGSGPLSYFILASNQSGSLPCSKAQCVSLPDCCFLITHERMDWRPSVRNVYSYSFTFTSQANTPITKLVFKPLQDGFSVNPTEIVFDPPLSPGSSANVTGISVQVGWGVASSSLCCKVAAYDANAFMNCNRDHCIPYQPLIVFQGVTDGARFLEPASFEIHATVSTNVTPAQVSFSWDNAVVFTTNAPPYRLALSGVTSGVHSLVGLVDDGSGGIFYSDPVSITVTQAPNILITSQPQDQTAVAGSSVTFSVSATGLPPLRYQWSNNGTVLAGATNASVTFTNLQAADSGPYCVRIANGGGVMFSTNAYLMVNEPPSISLQPRSQTNSPGGAVTFNVTAAGSRPLSYAWRFNNAVIVAATNRSLALTNLQPVQAGNYSVVVSNVAGTVTSSNAILTLGPDVPRILSGPASQRLTNGSSVTFSVSAAGALPLSYQWRFDGTNLASATRSTFTLPQVYETNDGFYGVVVTNVFGISEASALLTVLPPFFNFDLLNFGSRWSYDQSGADLGTAWREVGFDDSAWPSGQSLLGFDPTPSNWPEPIRTTLGIATNLTTYYFRAHFNFEFDVAGVTLIASSYVDDGAVFYLNGQEIIRLRMPSNDVTYQTLAIIPALKGELAGLNFQATNLVRGDNVLAVEVHQNRTNSDDIMFGMTLLALVPIPCLTCASNKTLDCSSAWSFDPPTVCCDSNVTLIVLSTVTNGVCPQSITRTWQATDCYSHSATCSQTVTVVDTTPPALTCVSSKSVPCGSAWTFDPPSAIDACCGTNVTISILSTVTNGNFSQAITRTWQASDYCSNLAVCSQTVALGPQAPYYEPFNYSVGANLGGQANASLLTWADVGTSTAGPYITVQSNHLSVSVLLPSTGNSIVFGGLGKSARFSFAPCSSVSHGTIYYSFALKVVDSTGLGTPGGFMAGFNNTTGTQTTQPSVVGTRLYMRSTNGGFNLGLSKNSSTATDWVWDSIRHTNDEDIFIVGSYTFSNGSLTDDVAKLWINPSPADFAAAIPPAPTLTNSAGTDLSAVASFVFFQRSSILEAAAMIADELRFDSTWAGVTPSAAPANLIIQRTGDQVEVSWTDANYHLQATPVLVPSAVWTNVSGASPLSIPIGPSTLFFRLTNP